MQCLTCLHTITYQQPKGKGYCRKTGNVHGLLERRECDDWKLAAMDMVRTRTVRRVVFDDRGIAMLE